MSSGPESPRRDRLRDPFESPELPLAEQRRRRREIGLAAGVIAAIVGVVLFERRMSGVTQTLPSGDSVLFLFLNALNVILIVLLVYLISRNLVKLVFERRRGILGSHLNLKFVLALFLVAAAPTGLVLFVSYSFISASIETWFSLQVDRALTRSHEVADAYYDAWAKNALHYGERIAEQVREQRLLREDQKDALGEFIQVKQREYNLGVVQVFPYAEAEPLVTFVNPEIPAAAFVKRDSAIVTSALGGEVASVMEATGTEIGDVIRGAVPIYTSDPTRPREVVGAVVVNHLVPHALAYKVEEIRAAVDQYRAVQPHAGSIEWSYQLELLLFSLVILLFALWWGFRMAKGVTTPIRALAEGTTEVARGNLDVVVETASDDEVGLLVHSFNQMTHDLREAYRGLELGNAELEQRRRYMEIVLRNVGAGVVSMDAESRISTINPSAQRLLGVPPGAGVVGHKLEEVLTQTELLDVVAELGRQTRAGVRESVRRQVQVPSGEEVHTLLVTLTLLQDDDGRPLGSVLVFDDYTQEVRAQRMAAWREVARRIAHEIKNPLTPIQLWAQRLRKKAADGSEELTQLVPEASASIEREVGALKQLVDEFSLFARMPEIRPRLVDLASVVDSVLALYKGLPDIRWRIEIEPDLPPARLDPDQIRRVLINLVENAVAATEGRGEIQIEAHSIEGGEWLCIEIADDGPGIDPADRDTMFSPYFSTKKRGTGLGLAIVHKVITDHHGSIRVEPNRPSGARFVIELPALEPGGRAADGSGGGF